MTVRVVDGGTSSTSDSDQPLGLGSAAGARIGWRSARATGGRRARSPAAPPVPPARPLAGPGRRPAATSPAPSAPPRPPRPPVAANVAPTDRAGGRAGAPTRAGPASAARPPHRRRLRTRTSAPYAP